MVAHASLMRNADAKPPNVNPITIPTVELRLASSDRRRGGGPDKEEKDQIR
jgi:hypothetical protein